MNKEFYIQHLPHGVSRYEKFGYERYPIYPLENDLVVIDAIVNSVEKTDNVKLKWILNGKKQKPVIGKKTKSSKLNRGFYRFEIDRFNAGDDITYQIEAISNNDVVKTKKFNFKVLSAKNADVVDDVIFKDGLLQVIFEEKECFTPRIYASFKDGYLELIASVAEIDISNRENHVFYNKNGYYRYTDSKTGFFIEVYKEPFTLTIKDSNGKAVLESGDNNSSFLKFEGHESNGIHKISLNYKTNNRCYYGFGEKFDSVNQIGKDPYMCNIDEYGHQEEKTYMPIPFFMSETGYGMYIDSSLFIKYNLSKNIDNHLEIQANVNDRQPFVKQYIFFGEPKEILQAYSKITGYPKLPPKWSLGPWISSNRWNTQKETIRQLDTMIKHKIPATVMVVEAWSDESTIHIFNDAKYKIKDGSEYFKYKDFNFDDKGKWPDPKVMIDYIHDNNLKFILWQIPVIRYGTGEDQQRQQQQKNYIKYAIDNKLCVMNSDGTPYKVPEGRWQAGSLVIDFTNPKAREWWFNKNRYLLEDLNIDGFKTDGGEFIYDDECVSHNGKRGDEMRNEYPSHYISAYHEFIGDKRITFSRDGFPGAQKYPLYWAGDKYSTFKEFRSIIVAGLSLNISGNPFFGFDIGGFAGEPPSSDLYLRSTQMAAFSPVMQFHSEPEALYKNDSNYNNDRSPWNISDICNDKRIIEIYRFYANIRMNILPYVYNEALNVSRNAEPLMRALVYEFPADDKVYNIEDQYMFGRDLLIAPVVFDKQRQREIYLPEGVWFDFWNGDEYKGNNYIKYLCDIEKIPVFIKKNSIIPLNLDSKYIIGEFIGNNLKSYINLCFLIDKGIPDCFRFEDDLGNKVKFYINNSSLCVDLEGNIDFIYIIFRNTNLLEEEGMFYRINDIDYYIHKVKNEGGTPWAKKLKR